MASKTHGSVRLRVRCLYDTCTMRRRRAPHHAVAATCRDILDHGPGPQNSSLRRRESESQRRVASRRRVTSTLHIDHRNTHNTTVSTHALPRWQRLGSVLASVRLGLGPGLTFAHTSDIGLRRASSLGLALAHAQTHGPRFGRVRVLAQAGQHGQGAIIHELLGPIGAARGLLREAQHRARRGAHLSAH